MPKFYKITHLEFNRRDPNRRKRRNTSRRTRVRIGGRLVKPGTYFHVNEHFFKTHKAEIEAYVRAGRIKVTGGASANTEQELKVSQPNKQPSAEVPATEPAPKPAAEKPVEVTPEAPKSKPAARTKPRSAKVSASTRSSADGKKTARVSSRASRKRKSPEGE